MPQIKQFNIESAQVSETAIRCILFWERLLVYVSRTFPVRWHIDIQKMSLRCMI